jgi:hypothetical protein
MSAHDDGGDGSRAGDDILELGRDRPRFPRWPSLRRRLPDLRWPSRPAAALLVAAGLVAGLAAGYAAGDHRAARNLAPALPSGAASQASQLAAGGAPLGQGPACSAQLGSDLQLGFQVTNVSASAVTLRQVLAVLPLGGLRPVAQAWGPCGELPQPEAAAATTLSPGASTWFTVTFKVLVRCPGPMPVQFALDYLQRGRPAAAHLPGFNDLSQVPYSGCP